MKLIATEEVGGTVRGVAERYAQMVYAAALRQTGNPQAAQDVMQAVFLVLIQKEKRRNGPPEGRMAGWLLQVTRYVVKEMRRESWRRRRREVAASRREMAMENAENAELREVLDAALLALGTVDREVLVRRYLRGQSVSAVGAAVGLSENTAGKRIMRALEKLRKILAGKGVSAPVGVVVGAMTAESAIHTPVAAGAVLSGNQKVAEELARRVLWHTVVMQGVAIGGAVLMVCAISAAVAVFMWRPVAGVAANLPASGPATTQVQQEQLMHVGAVLEENSDRLVQQILAGIETNRAKLRTLEVEGTVRNLPQVSPTDPFPESETTGKAWIDARTGRFRLEVSLQRMAATDGSPPSPDESYVETWDGEQLRTLHRLPLGILRGEIAAQEAYSSGANLLGRRFSMQLIQRIGFVANGQDIKQDPLDRKVLDEMRLSGRRVLMNGREVMELEARWKISETVEKAWRDRLEQQAFLYWFDASRGYAMVGYEEIMDGRPFDEQVVDALVEAAPGVFYPQRAHGLDYARDAETNQWHLWARNTFDATRVVANQPVDAVQFRLEFPQGVPVARVGASAVFPASQPATQR